MKARAAVQILTPEQFRRVFGRLSEAGGPEGDPVLDWYRNGGWRRLSGFEFEKSYAKRVGAKEPRRQDYDSDWRYDDAYREYLGRTFGRRDTKKFGRNAAAVLKAALGAGSFEFAGMGSDKAVFVDNAGHALKVARRASGVRSMAKEIRTSLLHKGLQCFPRLLAYAPDATSYVCECAMRPTKDDFRRLLGEGLDCADLAAVECQVPGDKFRETILPRADEPRYRALVDLAEFFKTESLGDVYEERNWGIAVRDGQEVLVVVDYDL